MGKENTENSITEWGIGEDVLKKWELLTKRGWVIVIRPIPRTKGLRHDKSPFPIYWAEFYATFRLSPDILKKIRKLHPDDIAPDVNQYRVEKVIVNEVPFWIQLEDFIEELEHDYYHKILPHMGGRLSDDAFESEDKNV